MLWPHWSICINSDYERIILVCLAIKYAHVWLSRAASQSLIGTSPSPVWFYKPLPLSVVMQFYQKGMCFTGLKYLFPLVLPEIFSATAKTSKIAFSLCGCARKFKQDEAVSQSSEVCVTKEISSSFNCYFILVVAYKEWNTKSSALTLWFLSGVLQWKRV